MDNSDFLDDTSDVIGADHVIVSWRAYGADGTILLNSDMALTGAQAAAMFTGIATS